MPIITSAQIQDRLTKLYAAYDAVLLGQSYTIGAQTLTRANLQAISAEIEKLESRLSRRGGTSSAGVVITPR